MASWVPVLESRLLLAAVADDGSTLQIDLQQDEFLSVSTNGSAYTFSSNQANVNGGVGDASVFSGFGSTTFTLDDLSMYTAVNITDSGSGTAIRFADSGTAIYQHDFTVRLLGEVPRDQPVGFLGASHFGDHDLDILTERSIHLFDGSSLSTNDGTIRLTATNYGDESGTLRGIVMVNASVATTGSGNISMRGTATGEGADLDFHLGISMQNGSTVSSTSVSADAGLISMHGSGGSGNQFNAGVSISTASQISSVSGDIRVTGTAGEGTGEGNRGIVVSDGSHITSTGIDQHAAEIYLEGRGGNKGTDRNDGVSFSGGSDIRTVSGNVQVVGAGGQGSGFSNAGVAFVNAMIVSSGVGGLAGKIELDGTGGAGINFNRGLLLNNTKVSSVDGHVLMAGAGGTATGNSNRAIEINNDSMIESTGTTSAAATITIDGRATGGVSFNNGLWLNNMTLNSVAGDITITGIGAVASGNSNNAASFTDAVVSSTGVGDLAAKISVHGTARAGTGFNSGIDLHRTTFRSVDGDIRFTGLGATHATLNSNRGVAILEASVIESTGTGSAAARITIEGQSLSGQNFNAAVTVNDESSVRSVDGDIHIDGRAANTSHFNNPGVAIYKSSVISTGIGADAATITLNGAAGAGVDSNHGVEFNQSIISSVDGHVEVTGTGNGTGDANRGIELLGNSVIESTGTTSAAARIQLLGNGAAGTGRNHGVFLRESRVSTMVGYVNISGNGGHGTGNSNYGVSLHENSILESTGSAPTNAQVFVQGIGGDAVDWNVGITVSTGATIRSASSHVSLNGHGGNGSGDSNRGINMVNFGTIESTGVGDDAATINITGNGGGGVGQNIGVFTLGADSLIRSQDGDIQVKGQAFLLSSGKFNSGVWLGTDLVSTGTARLTVIGSGEARTESGSNRGVTIGNAGTEIRSVHGDISVRGVGGGKAGGESGNTGVRLLPGTSIVSTHTAAISVTGDGGVTESHGVWLKEGDDTAAAAFIVSEGSGGIDIAGTGNGDDLRLDGASFVDMTAASTPIRIEAGRIHVSSIATLGQQSGADMTSSHVSFSGLIDPGGADGVTTLAGGATLLQDSTLVINTHGADASVPQFHDSLQGPGFVDISTQVSLDVRWNPAWSPTPGQVLTIIERTGGSGVFFELAEGGALPHFFNATISYVGGDGDDVTLTLPSVQSATDTTQPVVLNWPALPAAVSYDLWVGLIGDEANNPVINQTTTLSSYSAAANSVSLKFGRYRMWVRANYSDGETSEWAINTFTVDRQTTILQTPPFDGVQTRPTFEWESLTDAVAYRLFVSNTTTGEAGVVDEIVTGTSYRPANALGFGRYRIWVRPVFVGNYQSTWSEPSDYSIGPVPIGPVGAVPGEQQLFTWSATPGAATYQLFVSGPGGILVNESGISGASFTPSYNFQNKDFRWWVRGITSDGTLGAWSSAATFSTGGRTRIDAPEYNSIGPSFSWPAVPGAESYEIYIGKFSQPGAIYRVAGILDNSLPTLPLQPDSYAAWIRTTLADGTHVWGAATGFAVEEPVYQTNTTAIASVSGFGPEVTLEWAPRTGADSYDVYIRNNDPNPAAAAPTAGVISIGEVQGTTIEISDVPAGDWSWWVRPRTANIGAGEWSVPREFNTTGRVTEVEVDLSETRVPLFTWRPVSASTRYFLQVDNLTTGETKIIREDSLTEPVFSGISSLTVGNYRAWARAIGADGTVGPWSRQYDFTVM